MNTEERIARFRELWLEEGWAEECVDYLNEELAEDEFKARHVESIHEDSGRWYAHMLEVVEIDKDYFIGVRWDSGLTEMQENMYDDDNVYLLEKVKKVTTVIEWNALKTI